MKLFPIQLVLLASLCLSARASATGCGSFLTFCDGPLNPCPCGNMGITGNGCANSVNPLGANLTATGCADHITANDTVVLSGSGMPANSACLYFQGINAILQPFGDGVRCVSGQLIRLGLKTNVAGASAYPTGNDPKIDVKGAITLPGTYFYQVWYRDSLSYCTVSNYNLTNAVQIIWD